MPNKKPDQQFPGIVSAYEMPDEARIERVKSQAGQDTWAVRNGSNCLNSAGDYEYEPMPSARDDAFLARCRFDSVDTAYMAWKLHRESS